MGKPTAPTLFEHSPLTLGKMLLLFLLLCSALGSFVNERVVRVIDLQSQVEKQIVKAEISSTSSSSAKIYQFPIPIAKKSKLAFFKAVDEDSNDLVVNLADSIDVSKEYQEQAADFFFLLVELRQPLDKGEITQLTITLVYIHVLEMLPASIKQKDNQYVVYNGNRFSDSVYPTKKQHTKINIASESLKSYTKDGHEQLNGKKLKYGTYEDKGPFTWKSVRVHFRNNGAFLTMSDVVRDFEVSHWGNVRVSEFYNIRHDGAKLEGPYESMDAMGGYSYSGRMAEPSAVRELKATLPAGASRVTYTDRIGNISTSHFRPGRKKSSLELEMRYKLLGGWKTDFKITYDVAASGFISIQNDDPSLHTFEGNFGIPFNKPVASKVTTSIALPEGAYDINVHLPFGVDEQKYSVRYTYLDSQLFGGRPVVYFVKTNVVREHFEKFTITYRYAPFRIYYKVFMLSLGFFMFLMTFSFLGRLDLSLKDNSQNPALLLPFVRAILDLECETEKELFAVLDAFQTQANRFESLPSDWFKKLDRLYRMRNKKKRPSIFEMLKSAKNIAGDIETKIESGMKEKSS